MRILGYIAFMILVGAALGAPIPEDFNKNTVGFIYVGDTNGANLKPNGTCFFVGLPLTNNVSVAFMVTARHVLQDRKLNSFTNKFSSGCP